MRNGLRRIGKKTWGVKCSFSISKDSPQEPVEGQCRNPDIDAARGREEQEFSRLVFCKSEPADLELPNEGRAQATWALWPAATEVTVPTARRFRASLAVLF